MADSPSLTIRRNIKAPPAKIFSAWTNPQEIALWFGPPGTRDVRAEFDLREGGRFQLSFRLSDGEENGVSGVYREIVPDEKLVFTWAWRTTPERQSLVTILIRGDARSSTLTLIHEQFFDDATRDRHQKGWGQTL